MYWNQLTKDLQKIKELLNYLKQNQVELNAKSELISKIESGDFTLSFSAIKSSLAKKALVILCLQNWWTQKKRLQWKRNFNTLRYNLNLNNLKKDTVFWNVICFHSQIKTLEIQKTTISKRIWSSPLEQGNEIIDYNEWDNAIQHRDLIYNNEVINPIWLN